MNCCSAIFPSHPNPLWVGGYEGSPGIGTAAYTEGMTFGRARATQTVAFERVEIELDDTLPQSA